MMDEGWKLPGWMIRLHGSFSPDYFTARWLGERGVLTEVEVDRCTVDTRWGGVTFDVESFTITVNPTRLEVETVDDAHATRLPELVRHLLRFRNTIPITRVELVLDGNWPLADYQTLDVHRNALLPAGPAALLGSVNCDGGSVTLVGLIGQNSRTVVSIESAGLDEPDLLVIVTDKSTPFPSDPSIGAKKAVAYIDDSWSTFLELAPVLANAMVGRGPGLIHRPAPDDDAPIDLRDDTSALASAEGI